MIETLMISLPSLANIAGLLALMITIFSVLGVTFFYNVRPDQVRGRHAVCGTGSTLAARCQHGRCEGCCEEALPNART
eukprot:151529-Rhodomonas_salina.2